MNQPALRVENVTKEYRRGKTTVTALREINLDAAAGRVLAIIGFSGAGKSTLVRMFNGLETPTRGRVEVEGVDLQSLSSSQLRALRSRIGMVFQQFNLISSRTVYANIAYPLEIAGWDKERQRQRITELLHFVGLTERAWAYPSELSGGQKQRVGIARALATNPDILLADESTSALDPETTGEVLELLRRVNAELGVTIVVITHEMDVVRALADDVAVLSQGELVEHGPIEEVLRAPKAEATQRLLNSALRNVPADAELQQLAQRHEGRIVVVKTQDGVALGSVLARFHEHGADFEIVHGGVTPLKGQNFTTMTLALTGNLHAQQQAVTRLGQVAVVEEVTR